MYRFDFLGLVWIGRKWALTLVGTMALLALAGCELELEDPETGASTPGTVEPSSTADGSLIMRVQAENLNYLNVSIYEY